jgi:alanyl-tRNA synthetase
MRYTTGIVWQKFQDFFKKRGHLLRPAGPLIPENEASVLFTTAGMQQFKQYYLEPQKAPAARIISCQPCIRTTDIDEVGDETHLTIFEMLGNFSFGYPRLQGSYFKKEAIEFAWEFLTEILKIPPKRLLVTYFGGDKEIPKDTESRDWLLKITRLEETRILPRDREENFWGPTGESGPCGRTVEIRMDGVEIWNLVFNEFLYKDGKFLPLEYLGVDTGAGLERLTALLNNYSSVYDVDTLKPIKEKIGISSSKSKIIVDHLRTIAHLIVAGVFPSNKEQGYILRRLIRRTLKAGLDLNLK